MPHRGDTVWLIRGDTEAFPFRTGCRRRVPARVLTSGMLMAKVELLARDPYAHEGCPREKGDLCTWDLARVVETELGADLTQTQVTQPDFLAEVEGFDSSLSLQVQRAGDRYHVLVGIEARHRNLTADETIRALCHYLQGTVSRNKGA